MTLSPAGDAIRPSFPQVPGRPNVLPRSVSRQPIYPNIARGRSSPMERLLPGSAIEITLAVESGASQTVYLARDQKGTYWIKGPDDNWQRMKRSAGGGQYTFSVGSNGLQQIDTSWFEVTVYLTNASRGDFYISDGIPDHGTTHGTAYRVLDPGEETSALLNTIPKPQGVGAGLWATARNLLGI